MTVPTPGDATSVKGDGRPLGRPVAWSNRGTRRKESDESEPTRAGNTVSSGGVSSVRRRVGRRGLLNVAESLTDRDWAVLRSVAGHRFLTTRHVEALHFIHHASPLAAARATRRVLLRLSSLHLLTHLERRVGGVRAGSASFVWRIGVVGDRLLRQQTGDSVRQRLHEPSERFLNHCLAIADAHVALTASHRATQLELLTVQLEPDCWRSYLGRGGERRTLQPDLSVVTGAGEFEDHWFIEIDLGTEHLPTVIKKCQEYLAYRRTGREQQDGGVFPVIVWVVPDEARASKLQAALRAARALDMELFRVTTTKRFVEVIAGGAA